MISILQFIHSNSFENENEINVLLVVSHEKSFIYVLDVLESKHTLDAIRVNLEATNHIISYGNNKSFSIER